MVDGWRAALLATCCLCAAQSFASNGPLPVPEPTIPPGYRPELARDERGLWMELDDYEKSVARSPLLIRDHTLTGYLENLVCRIGGDYCADFRVYLLRNPYFNASMGPNGMMQVWTGLLVRTANEDELASVIGHEIAHYLRAHSLAQFRKIRKGMATGSIFSFGLGLFTGVLLPIGEMAAILNVLAFSREQETEADLLGARLMADAGFDPHATYRIWRTVIEEDERAEVKREEPGVFSQTHPESAARAEYLEQWVTARFGPPQATANDDAEFQALRSANFDWLMEDQIKTARYGRTEFLLERLETLGAPVGSVHYYRARMLEQRGEEGDAAAAQAEYERAVSETGAPAEANRNLGYLLLKGGDTGGAGVRFRRYLELKPEATDRAMIEFYVREEP